MSEGRGVHGYRWGAVLGCYLYRALASGLAALPLGLAVGTVMGAHPRGDAALWDEGGIWLLETGRLVAPSLRGAVGQGGVILLLASFGWLLPLGALIASQAPHRPATRACLRRAAERLGPMALLLGVVLMIQALLLAGLGIIGKGIGEGLTPTADVLRVVVPLGALGIWWLLGLLHDALRVMIIQRDRPWWELLNGAWELLANRPGAAVLASGWRTLLGLAVVLGAAVMGFEASGRGELVSVVVMHQLAILCVVTLRASWLGWLNRRLFSQANWPAEEDNETSGVTAPA